MKEFYKKVNKNNNKEMYEFLKYHFSYYTMSSWNGLESIANNVKLYTLGLTDWEKALDILEVDDYTTINDAIYNWENEHSGYSVGFNGASGGYLVLYNKGNNKSILPYEIDISTDYDDFKSILKDYNCTLKNYHYELVEYVELVQEFDKLCDDLVGVVQDMIDTYDIENEEYTEVKTRKILVEKMEG